MHYSKWFVWLALAAGMAIPGATTLSAQTYYPYSSHDYQYSRRDYRYSPRAEQLRADMARDRARLDEAVRCGRSWEAERIQRDMARDRQELRRVEGYGRGWDYGRGWGAGWR